MKSLMAMMQVIASAKSPSHSKNSNLLNIHLSRQQHKSFTALSRHFAGKKISWSGYKPMP